MSKFSDFIFRKDSRKQRFNGRSGFCSKFLFNVRFWNIIILVLISLVGVLYLGQINSMTIKGFKMKTLEEKQSAFKENIRKMELQIADLQSMQKIQERVKNLNMISVAKVEYVAPSGTVAVK